ncbi:MAG: DNA replication/repair protein RecF [Bacteroidia bacterium]|nr:DNA replication/repair protein RecF [Bacteroidia bacterium]
MHLQKLQLGNFKNYERAEVDFPSKINVLVGKNGSGKTNLLEAVYYLSFTKGAVVATDSYYIKEGQAGFHLRGTYQMAGATHTLSCGVHTGTKKIFREDDRDYPRLSDHIGKYPATLVAPDDVDLVKEGGEQRRKFFDALISQIDHQYLEALMKYNHALKQRNGLLRLFQHKPLDVGAIEAYDQVLVPLGKSIYQLRQRFVQEFTPVFTRYYDFLVSHEEAAGLEYVSALADVDFDEGLKRNRMKDLALQRTAFGIHRDDFKFILGEGDLKKMGSQGQQKSFVIAMKLAQWELLKIHKGFDPILLLDDIFDKLDDYRIGQLLELIRTDFGQLFITDARPDRTQGLLRQVHLEASVFEVYQGTIRTKN